MAPRAKADASGATGWRIRHSNFIEGTFGETRRRVKVMSTQSGYSSLRQERGSAGWAFGVRSSRELKYGATNGSGAATV